VREQIRLRVQFHAPLIHRARARVVEAGRVLAVPVRAALQRHVEADEDDLLGAELAGEVETVKAAVP